MPHSFHHLNKPKHLVGHFSRFVLLLVGQFPVGTKILAPKLVNPKTALVHVKMDVALLKIGGAVLPDHRLGMECLYRLPRTVSDTSAVYFGRREQYFQMVVVRFAVYFQYHAAYLLVLNDNTVGFVLRIVDTAFDSLTGNYLSVAARVWSSRSPNSCSAPYLNAH